MIEAHEFTCTTIVNQNSLLQNKSYYELRETWIFCFHGTLFWTERHLEYISRCYHYSPKAGHSNNTIPMPLVVITRNTHPKIVSPCNHSLPANCLCSCAFRVGFGSEIHKLDTGTQSVVVCKGFAHMHIGHASLRVNAGSSAHIFHQHRRQHLDDGRTSRLAGRRARKTDMHTSSKKVFRS